MIALLFALQIPPAAITYREDMTRSAFRVFGPSAPVATLAAQIHQESAWNPNARSRVGALGLSQFMPATAADQGRLYPDCRPVNALDPSWSLRCRDRYLFALNRNLTPLKAGLTECSRWAFGLRAYNGGSVYKDRVAAMNRHLDPDNWREVANVNGRNRSPANFRENTEYPVRINRLAPRYVAAGWGRAVCP